MMLVNDPKNNGLAEALAGLGLAPSRIPTLLSALCTAETSDQCLQVANDLAQEIRTTGYATLQIYQVLECITSYLNNKKNGLQREGGLIALLALARNLGKEAFPLLLPLVSHVLELHDDKGPPVRNAAKLVSLSLVKLSAASNTRLLLSSLLEGLKGKWQCKIACLEYIKAMTIQAPAEVCNFIPGLITPISDAMFDTKSEVPVEAVECMKVLCSVVGNPDIEQHIPILVGCMARPTEVPECIKKLSATTFVADVSGPALAIMVPLLVRALSERSPLILRPTCIIIDNLCKLVKNPAEAGQFLPDLMPGLSRIIDTGSFPEIRALATAARSTLVRVGGDVAISRHDNLTEPIQDPLLAARLRAIVSKMTPALTPHHEVILSYAGLMYSELQNMSEFDYLIWESTADYLLSFWTKEQAHCITKSMFDYAVELAKSRGVEIVQPVLEQGEELCNIEFSLAYGGMMLLNRTRLRLLKGHRYGLCGANGAGKSTLMRSISLGKLEGFPPEDQLRTVFVEHTLQGEEASLPIIDFIASDKRLSHVPRKDIAETLLSVGFDDGRQSSPVGSLSGGWKMKLELARAMLLKADILLLDEPTNHLDVENIAWLVNYLQTNTQITSLIVSHDSEFLDNVCTNIIHYEKKKLVNYIGNLSKFVERKPEAKSYYTLSSSNVKFTFPPPAFLAGIRSSTKAILRMKDVTYTYPGAPKPSLIDVSVQLSMASRVAVIGPNGAGKSTMIKLLTGELIPQIGTQWKHPNLRVGYVAQHAFHHLNQHLDLTPSGYIQWRYQGGEDREVLEKASRKLTTEDLEQMSKTIMIKGAPRTIEFLIGRSKLKKSYQYEIKWVGLVHKHNTWMPREELLELGFNKIVQAFDDREASREGQAYRELTPPAVRKHLEDVGLDGDIAEHNLIAGLSGGQKVKVVIAAAMWNNPHMLVLDEPTNYLDRDSLGGLAVAIRDWAGAVVMISHNAEFVGALCPEKWHVEAGRLTAKGVSAVETESFEAMEATTAKVEKLAKPKKKKMTRNDLKEREIRRRTRHLKWLAEGIRDPDTESD